MNRSSSNSFLVIAFIAIAMSVILLGVSNVAVRVIFSLPLVLILPGYALTAAALPKRTIGVAEGLLFSLGLSLAIAVLAGLALNWMPRGLRADSWAVLLGGFTLLASLVALLRRRECPAVDTGRLVAELHVRQVLLFGLAILVVVGAIEIARIGVLRQPTSPFTQLWILSADETDQAILVGVRSMESSTKRYNLQVQVSGRMAREWPLIELEPGQTWETTVVLPMEKSEDGAVEAVLFLLDAPQVAYRHVIMWRDR